jgi:histidinol-phosphate aminotransferase
LGSSRACAPTRHSRRMAAAASAAPAAAPTPPPAAGTASGAQFLRPHLLKLAPYTPIEPFEVLSARYGRRPEDIVKLDANENPYGPPPEVREALAAMPFPHIYPDPETRRLRAALAKWCGVPAEQLLVRSALPTTWQRGVVP